MSWTATGSIGTATSKVNGDTISFSPNRTIAVDEIIIVWSAWDNQNGATSMGPIGSNSGGQENGSDHLFCSDTQGNDWWTIASGSATGVDARTHGTLFICQVTNSLTTGDSITVHHIFPKDAKAISAETFSLGAGEKWVAADRKHLYNTASDPGPISMPGHWPSLPARQWLFVHLLAAEGPSTDTYTWDSDYTQITSVGTTGGGADTNQTINGGYRIATLTGDTVDVTSNTADRDYTQLFCALGYYTPGDFPTTPLLDDFNRANEQPIFGPATPSGGFWIPNSAGAAGTNNTLRIISNVAAVQSGATSNGGQLWDEDFREGDQEAWATIVNAPDGIGDWAEVRCRQIGSGATAVANMDGDAGVWKHPRHDHPDVLAICEVKVVVHFHFGLGWINCEDGYKIGVKRQDSQSYVGLWVDRGGGWEHMAAYYRDAPTGTAPFASPDRIGMNIRQNCLMDDFGGGAPPAEFMPQIYRWLNSWHTWVPDT